MAGKTKYKKWLEKENLLLLTCWARDGLTDEIIAQEKIGIRRETLYTWKKKFPVINNALKNGKEVADYAVEMTLYKKAMAGDITAIIFWLKNRKPDQWRDRREFTKENTGQIDRIIEAVKNV
ncbi:MAG: hypothetical protein WC319_05375 [Candidatus Paceibacterota bacterium]|jgi:hypothetical protein